jgi:hypothetical protein
MANQRTVFVVWIFIKMQQRKKSKNSITYAKTESRREIFAEEQEEESKRDSYQRIYIQFKETMQ